MHASTTLLVDIGDEAAADMCTGGCRTRADDLRAFLEASAKGWAFAAEQPGPAAELLTQLATSENRDLPQPLDAEMVHESQVFISQVYLPQNWQHGNRGPQIKRGGPMPAKALGLNAAATAGRSLKQLTSSFRNVASGMRCSLSLL